MTGDSTPPVMASQEDLPRIPALSGDLLAELIKTAQRKSFPRNTIVVLEGDIAETLYVILEGTVRVYVADEDGKEAELNVMGPGEYFGELMLGSQRRTASVKTLTPAKFCVVQRPDFERVLADRPDIAFHVIHTLIHRIRVLTTTVSNLALMDVYGRVAQLFTESARDSEGQRVVPAMSQQKIAERVGASRSMINRILKDLSKGGYISIGKTEIVLLKALPKRW
ncbi:MAG TPA: Crp/Fnr family transcriptional regulator [Burkholderiaceae bacterium]|jgi:CRP/FNR family cyclic AMP-dependent transcriptional regulator|nr:Crp/Fnr family transcriptional regulator [Burkholderiaceae bacterium]